MRSRHLAKLSFLAVTVVACSGEPTATTARLQAPAVGHAFLPAATTIVVKPSSMNGACQTLAVPVACYSLFPSGWLFYNDENDQGDPTLGSFVSGPGSPLHGVGGSQISVSGSQRRNLATYQFAGTPLASITTMSFRTYNPSAGNGGSATRSAYLQFNVDFNGSDTWQRRLVYVPSQNGTVVPDTWKEWDAIAGGNALWAYSGATWPITGQSGATLKTWSQVLSDYAGIRIRLTDAHLGMRVGEPYADGYTENIDAFTFGTASGTTVFDFEPEWYSCAVNNNGSSYTLLADCTTTQTLLLPNGYTLNGAGFSITATDPVGGHFLGAVVKNGGATAHVTNVTITALGLANVCDGGDDRLRGILFDGAGGSITNTTVTGVRQGLSGCQEGNAIEVRNAPFDKTGSDLAVSITNNTVSNYQKNGITANGSVAATITGNLITGDGPVTYIAQNGLQVGFGATAVVNNNRVAGNNYTPASFVACGFLIFQADGIRASKNVFANNERDQCNFGKGGGIFNPAP